MAAAVPQGPPPQEIARMTRTALATSLLGEAATYTMAAAYFGGFIIAIEFALSRLVY
jgi:hypothetical protein